MFSHTFNGLTYSDASSSSSSSSPNSFHHSPLRPPSTHLPPRSQVQQVADVPSTFLPSYYPEGRYASLDADHSGSHEPFQSSRSHSPATWEKISQAGPSTRHLLDGTNLTEPRPKARTIKRELGPPEYRITPESIASSFVNKTSASFPMDPSLQSGSHSSTPNSLGNASPGGGGGGGTGSGRYHPYSQQSSRDKDQPSNSVAMSSSSGSMSRHNTYNNSTMPDPAPSSTAYPGNLYGNVPLPERPELDPWERVDGDVTGEDYAQALEIYSHMLEAVPSMRPQHDPVPPGGQRFDHLLNLASDGLSFLSGPNHHPNLGHNPDNGPSSVPGLNPNKRPAPYAAGNAPGMGMNGEKKVTKCLGCGATETPEWRRGPMGPRTLCNACGLVHMKLQRKKKKQEEKAAAAAAAAANR